MTVSRRNLLMRIGLSILVLVTAGIWLNAFKEEPEKDPIAERAKEYSVTDYYQEDGGFLRDKVELTKEYRDHVKEVTEMVDKEMGQQRPGELGSLYRRSQRAREIFRDKFHIEWRSVFEMNPWVPID
jgi:hypothetical protein